MTAFRLNVFGWVLQLLGTTFLLLDSIRVSIRLPREGVRLGDPPEVASWIFQLAAPIGFGLLFVGFAVSGVTLWLSRLRQPNESSTASPSSSSDEESTIAKELHSIQEHAGQTMPALNFLAERVDREQEIYWQRFYSFATLHAGAFVLATSSSLSIRWPIELAGLVLALIWFYVQWLSLKYVDRLKPLYHAARVNAGIRFVQPEWLSARRGLSSTDIGVGVTIVVAITWTIALAYL